MSGLVSCMHGKLTAVPDNIDFMIECMIDIRPPPLHIPHDLHSDRQLSVHTWVHIIHLTDCLVRVEQRTCDLGRKQNEDFEGFKIFDLLHIGFC